MRNNRLFWAIFFLGIGGFFLLHNFGFPLFQIDVKFVIPSLVILWGAYLIVKEKTVRSIIAGFNGLLFALLIAGIFQFGYGVSVSGFDIEIEDFNDIEPTLTSPTDSTRYANFIFDGGVTGLIIHEDSTALVNVSVAGDNKNYSLITTDIDDTTKSVDLTLEGKKLTFVNGKFENKVKVGLNTAPVWNIDMHAGLSSFNLDLSKYKINDINIDMGLSSLKLKLGANTPETNVSIDGGLSSIEIQVPSDAGCQIETDNGLTETNVREFMSVGEDKYQSANFNTAEKKIYIKVKAGLSSLCITKIK